MCKMKGIKKITALFLAFLLMFGMVQTAAADTAAAEPYMVLDAVKAVKAGETAYVNLRTDKEVNLGAFEFVIALDSTLVEMTTAKEDDEYSFFAETFSYTGGFTACNYDSGKNEVLLTGANANDTKFKSGTLIAQIQVKAKKDLKKGDVIATLTNKYIADVNETVLVENETALCVITEESSYKITMNLCGGTGETEKELFAGQKIKNLPEPSYKNYIFKGWYQDEDCKVYLDPETEITKAMDVYAGWAKLGDADGDGEVSAEDALKVLKRVANILNDADFEGVQLKQADTDKNGEISAEDALQILKYVAHMINGFEE